MFSAFNLCSKDVFVGVFDMKKKKILNNGFIRNLLSFLSQLSTLAFQSQVCFSMSNAKPEGQVICFSPARVHLNKR